jgi:hypothetical protein
MVKHRTKASEGAERSFRKRRRKRGQRKGRRRSRGRHPRSSTLPPARSPTLKDRSLRHHLRGMDYWKDQTHQFCLKVRSRRERIVRPSGTRAEDFARWRVAWDRLSCRLLRNFGKLQRDVFIGHTFLSFLEDRLGWPVNSAVNDSNNTASFDHLLGHLRRSLPVKKPKTISGNRPTYIPGGRRTGKTRRFPLGPFCTMCGEPRGPSSPMTRLCIPCYNKWKGISGG